MKKHISSIAVVIINIIDFFYPPFSRIMTKKFFRYGVSGASNVVLDWVLYFITYNYILQRENIELPFITVAPHIASFILVFPITFCTGFLLSKFVTFTESTLKGKVQLFRYLTLVVICILINYFGLKIMVEQFGLYPTPSKMIITIFTTLFSYFYQNYFTFKK